jgi:hypothetical protein
VLRTGFCVLFAAALGTMNAVRRKETEYEKAWRGNYWLRLGGGGIRKGLSKQ